MLCPDLEIVGRGGVREWRLFPHSPDRNFRRQQTAAKDGIAEAPESKCCYDDLRMNLPDAHR
jgi:hypothetical protein